MKHVVVHLGQIVKPRAVDTAPLKATNHGLIVMIAYEAHMV